MDISCLPPNSPEDALLQERRAHPRPPPTAVPSSGPPPATLFLPRCFCYPCNQVLSCCCNKPSKAKSKGTCLRSNSANLHGLCVWPECVRFRGGSKRILLVNLSLLTQNYPSQLVDPDIVCDKSCHVLSISCARHVLSIISLILRATLRIPHCFCLHLPDDMGGVTCPRTQQVVFKVPFNYWEKGIC